MALIKWDAFTTIERMEFEFKEKVMELKDPINKFLAEEFEGIMDFTLDVFSIPKFQLQSIKYGQDTSDSFSSEYVLRKSNITFIFGENNPDNKFKISSEISYDDNYYKWTWLYLECSKELGNLQDRPLFNNDKKEILFPGTRTAKNPDRMIEIKGGNRDKSCIQNYIQLPLGIPHNKKELIALHFETILVELEEVLWLVAKNIGFFTDPSWSKAKKTPGIDDLVISLDNRLKVLK